MFVGAVVGIAGEGAGVGGVAHKENDDSVSRARVRDFMGFIGLQTRMGIAGWVLLPGNTDVILNFKFLPSCGKEESGKDRSKQAKKFMDQPGVSVFKIR